MKQRHAHAIHDGRAFDIAQTAVEDHLVEDALGGNEQIRALRNRLRGSGTKGVDDRVGRRDRVLHRLLAERAAKIEAARHATAQPMPLDDFLDALGLPGRQRDKTAAIGERAGREQRAFGQRDNRNLDSGTRHLQQRLGEAADDKGVGAASFRLDAGIQRGILDRCFRYG